MRDNVQSRALLGWYILKMDISCKSVLNQGSCEQFILLNKKVAINFCLISYWNFSFCSLCHFYGLFCFMYIWSLYVSFCAIIQTVSYLKSARVFCLYRWMQLKRTIRFWLCLHADVLHGTHNMHLDPRTTNLSTRWIFWLFIWMGKITKQHSKGETSFS